MEELFVERKIEGAERKITINDLNEFYSKNKCEFRFERNGKELEIYITSSKETFDLFKKLYC